MSFYFFDCYPKCTGGGNGVCRRCSDSSSSSSASVTITTTSLSVSSGCATVVRCFPQHHSRIAIRSPPRQGAISKHPGQVIWPGYTAWLASYIDHLVESLAEAYGVTVDDETRTVGASPIKFANVWGPCQPPLAPWPARFGGAAGCRRPPSQPWSLSPRSLGPARWSRSVLATVRGGHPPLLDPVRPATCCPAPQRALSGPLPPVIGGMRCPKSCADSSSQR